MTDLTTKYLGLTLKNPIIVSSSGLTKDIAHLQRCAGAGCGAAVMKSLFEAEVARRDPTPCYRFIRRGDAVGGDAVAFYSYEQASDWGPDRYAEEVKLANEELDIPVIPSINCVTIEGWRNYAKRMQDTGAQAIELNVSCPYGSVTSGGENAEDLMLKSVEAALDAVSIPVAVKLPGRLTSPERVVARLEAMGVKGVVMFNRFAGLDIDIETEMPVMHGGAAGHGGAFSIHYPLLWVSRISPAAKLDIAASGGVYYAEDVIKYILAGADVVQVCTAIYMYGYELIGKLMAGLTFWMDAKGYREIDAFRGKVSGDAVADMYNVDRERKCYFVIDSETCTGCGLCKERCLHDAIIEEDASYKIINRECVACGFCAEICPAGAIAMFPLKDKL